MIGKYPIVERSERNALARAVARSRRMQRAISDRAQIATVRSTGRGTAAPDLGGGERVSESVDLTVGVRLGRWV